MDVFLYPKLNGILFTLLFALSSYYLASLPWAMAMHLSPLIIAVVCGMIYGSTLRRHLPHEWTPGIQFVSKRILRLAIIFYGFRLTFQQVFTVGWEGFILDVLIVSITLLLGSIIGMRVFKLDRDTSILISCGAAICGAAAVLAAEIVLKSEAYKATIAILSVVLFGTTAMFLYPILQQNHILGLDNFHYGIYAGATIHEVAQALVAGAGIDTETGVTAVIVKMTRVMLLVPVLFILKFLLSHHPKTTTQHSAFSTLPWFAILFIVVVGFNSFKLLNSSSIAVINEVDTFMLTLAMAAIGIETNFAKIKHIGLKPLYLSLFLFAWLMVGGYGLSRLVFNWV